MDIDWLEFYGLKGDPFSAAPLRHPVDFREVFVTTPLIQNQIEPIIRTIDESDKYLYLILGERGAGKSTLLWYIYHKLNERDDILPIHVSLIPKTYDTQHQEQSLAIALSNLIASKTLDRINNKFNDLYLNPMYRLDKIKKKLTEQSLKFKELSRIVPKIFTALVENDKIPIIIVDNLDKFKEDLALDFLSYHHGQALFEDIFQPYVKFFIAAESKWSEKFNSANYSYLGDPVIIKPVNYLEAKTLIEKRIERKVKDKKDFIFPFKNDAITFITQVSKGIPRNIQNKCTTYMQQGAQSNIREIDRDILLEIEKKVGKEFDLVRELSARDPIVEKDIAFLLEIRAKFIDSKAFEEALFNVLKLLQAEKVDDDTLDQLRDSGMVSIVIEDPKKPSQLAINSHIEELFNRIKEKMQLKEFIEWFCRSDVDTIPITKARWSILDDFARIKDSLPDVDFKKEQIEKILTDYELFRESYYEDEEQSVCAETAINIAQTAIGLIEPGMSVTNKFKIEDYLNMLKTTSLSNTVHSDFYILYGYYCRPPEVPLSYRDLNVIQEKLNDLLEIIQKIYEEISLEKKILFSDSDLSNLGNFLNKRLLESRLLMISPSEEEMKGHILICWCSKKTGIYGTNIKKKEYNYFDAALNHYEGYYQFIPYGIQDLLGSHGLSEDLLSRGSKKKFAQHYELAILLNLLATHYLQLKLIFASEDKATFWTVKSNVPRKRIELFEEETLTNTPLFPYLNKKLGINELAEKEATDKLNIDRMPGKYENRVFIGGNYDLMANLKEIKEYVRDNVCEPILAIDFDPPKDKINAYDLRLLHNCKYAIFDETQPAGEIAEIERTKEYETVVLIVYQIRDPAHQEPPPQITSMVTTLRYPMCGYSSFEELKKIIADWLSDIKRNK